MSIFKIDESELVPIIGDGAIANPDIGEGRMILALILDCDNNKELYDLILLHESTPPGDVSSIWGRLRTSKKAVFLRLKFSRPAEVSATFRFNIEQQGHLVDWIINSQCVYLQPKDSGFKVSEGIDNPKILVEVPLSTKIPGWDQMYLRALKSRFRKKGLSRKQSKDAALQHLARTREIHFLRRNIH